MDIKIADWGSDRTEWTENMSRSKDRGGGGEKKGEEGKGKKKKKVEK